MEKFIYQLPIKTYFGNGVTEEALKAEMPKMGQNVMLAYGGGSLKRTGTYEMIVKILSEAGKNVIDFAGIMPNPTFAKVQEGAQIARENDIDFILAVGGGSVIDCCKIVAAQAKTDKSLWDMEFVEKKRPTEMLSMGAIVTASGTGAEMNNGAVITNEDLKIKTGMVGAYAGFSVLDPLLTMTVPMRQVISGAFDTLSHAMETYFGKPGEDNVSDEINEAIMRNTIRNTYRAFANPDDVFARGELMWDSAMAENGILKLGKETDFQAHMIEHQLGAYTDCNHGQGLAVIHPALYRHIYKEYAAKFARFAKEVWKVESDGLSDEQVALAGIEALADFIKKIGLPTTLTQMGITDREMLRKVADSTVIRSSCAKQLTHDEIFEILEECL